MKKFLILIFFTSLVSANQAFSAEAKESSEESDTITISGWMIFDNKREQWYIDARTSKKSKERSGREKFGEFRYYPTNLDSFGLQGYVCVKIGSILSDNKWKNNFSVKIIENYPQRAAQELAEIEDKPGRKNKNRNTDWRTLRFQLAYMGW